VEDPPAREAAGRARSGPIVALDGPASSGKSSVGAAAAERLGYRFCDTGLLYRAVTWLALHRRVSADDAAGLVQLVDEVELRDDAAGRLAHVAVDGVDRTVEVHGPTVDEAVSAVSRVPELRAALMARQRGLAEGGRIIMAGRDIGTVVLPDADLKLYLDASAEERATRRAAERGIGADSPEAEEILQELRRRDRLDSSRPVAPLRAAPDALILETGGNAFEDTVGLVVEAIRAAEARGEREAAARGDRAASVYAGPRRQRRPIKPTPIATRMGPLISLGSLFLRVVARLIVRIRFEGSLADVPRQGPLIVAGNHVSSADPVLVGAFLNKMLGRPLNWLGKRELVEAPVTGWMFRKAGIHPVDREAADLEAFRTAMRVLDAGHILAVFPEGSRSLDGTLQPVREGVGLLALRSGAPVLPVAVVDSDRAWPKGRRLPRFGRSVTVRFGQPFDVAAELERTGRSRSGDGRDGHERGERRDRREDRRQATEAATRLVMIRIAELLPPRQRGVYAAAVAEARGAPPPTVPAPASDPG
jgi:cytidylate kinase